MDNSEGLGADLIYGSEDEPQPNWRDGDPDDDIDDNDDPSPIAPGCWRSCWGSTSMKSSPTKMMKMMTMTMTKMMKAMMMTMTMTKMMKAMTMTMKKRSQHEQA